MADYEAFFREADTDGSGTLTLDEVIAILRAKGYNDSVNEIKKMFDAVDLSGDGLINLTEFLVAMGAQEPAYHDEAYMRAVFRQFDKDGNGQIDKSELNSVFLELGKKFSDADLEKMIAMSDADGSGCLDYEEFVGKVCKKK